MNFLKISLTSLLFGLILTAAMPVLADAPTATNCPPGTSLEDCQKIILNQIGDKSNYGQIVTADEAQNKLANRIGQAGTIVLGFLGVIFLFFVTYSGIQWMTAGGNEERITKARGRITRAAVGLIIVVSAYALTSFVLSKIQTKPLSCSSFSTAETCPAGCMWTADFNECSEL